MFAVQVRTVALLEAGATTGIAPFLERGREIVATAIAANQFFELGGGPRWPP
jgi:hypothetical protein